MYMYNMYNVLVFDACFHYLCTYCVSDCRCSSYFIYYITHTHTYIDVYVHHNLSQRVYIAAISNKKISVVHIMYVYVVIMC